MRVGTGSPEILTLRLLLLSIVPFPSECARRVPRANIIVAVGAGGAGGGGGGGGGGAGAGGGGAGAGGGGGGGGAGGGGGGGGGGAGAGAAAALFIPPPGRRRLMDDAEKGTGGGSRGGVPMPMFLMKDAYAEYEYYYNDDYTEETTEHPQVYLASAEAVIPSSATPYIVGIEDPDAQLAQLLQEVAITEIPAVTSPEAATMEAVLNSTLMLAQQASRRSMGDFDLCRANDVIEHTTLASVVCRVQRLVDGYFTRRKPAAVTATQRHIHKLREELKTSLERSTKPPKWFKGTLTPRVQNADVVHQSSSAMLTPLVKPTRTIQKVAPENPWVLGFGQTPRVKAPAVVSKNVAPSLNRVSPTPKPFCCLKAPLSQPRPSSTELLNKKYGVDYTQRIRQIYQNLKDRGFLSPKVNDAARVLPTSTKYYDTSKLKWSLLRHQPPSTTVAPYFRRMRQTTPPSPAAHHYITPPPYGRYLQQARRKYQQTSTPASSIPAQYDSIRWIKLPAQADGRFGG